MSEQEVFDNPLGFTYLCRDCGWNGQHPPLIQLLEFPNNPSAKKVVCPTDSKHILIPTREGRDTRTYHKRIEKNPYRSAYNKIRYFLVTRHFEIWEEFEAMKPKLEGVPL